jgi:predicted nucleic acid-binding protein
MADATIDYVLDANIIMSMFIRGKARYEQLIKLFRFYSPDYLFTELEIHQAVILTKTQFDEAALRHFTINLFSRLTILPALFIQENDLKKARFYCEGVDSKDVAYVALSISLDIPLLTRDKPLYTGLRKKGFRNVLLFNDFLALQQ